MANPDARMSNSAAQQKIARLIRSRNDSVRIVGGDKFKEFERSLRLNSKFIQSIDIGFLRNETYANGMTVARVAYINEYGVTVPERPFMRRSATSLKRDMQFKRLARKSIVKDPDKMRKRGIRLSVNGRARLGLYIVRRIQQTITDLHWPPNAPSTIARKGSSNPLIDTGHMRQSVSWRITPQKDRLRSSSVRISPSGTSAIVTGGGGVTKRGPSGITAARAKLYKLSRLLGDFSAVRSGQFVKRLERRGLGRFSQGAPGRTFSVGLGAISGMGGATASRGAIGRLAAGTQRRTSGGTPSGITQTRSMLYRAGKLLGDYQAIRSGHVGGRAVRRGTGKVSGRGVGSITR